MENLDETPLISIVIPVYNSAHTILRAIRSILIQDFSNYEIVVVDDGSTDDISAVLKSMDLPRLHYFCHDTNKGEAAARTTGVQKARGEYIAYLDADDEWLPGKINLQLAALSAIHAPIKACITSTYVEDSHGRISLNKNVQPASWYHELMLTCHMDPGTTLLVSRGAFDEVGYYDSDLPRYTDWDWMLRYTQRGLPLITLPEPLAKIYRLTHPRAKSVEKAASHFLRKHSEYFLNHGFFHGRKAISRRWFEVAGSFASEHDFFKMSFFLLRGVVIYPFQPLHVWAWLINNWFGIKIGSFLLINKKAN